MGRQPLPTKRPDALTRSLAGTNRRLSHRTKLARERDLLVAQWAEHPWSFLTGVDEGGNPIIRTKDESDEQTPYKPFPLDKPYLHSLTVDLTKHRVVLLNKSRQMMVSTLCCLLLYWTLLFRPGRRMLVSKQTESLAVELIRDKIRGVHERTPVWFQQRYSISRTPANRIDCKQTDGYILAVAQNAAVGAMRGGTASIVLIDEAAFQDQFPEMMQAAGPMASRVWAVTTANIGNPGAEYFYRIMREGQALGEDAENDGTDESAQPDL